MGNSYNHALWGVSSKQASLPLLTLAAHAIRLNSTGLCVGYSISNTSQLRTHNSKCKRLLTRSTLHALSGPPHATLHEEVRRHGQAIAARVVIGPLLVVIIILFLLLVSICSRSTQIHALLLRRL